MMGTIGTKHMGTIGTKTYGNHGNKNIWEKHLFA
jgi:hypothetical protein